MKGALVRADSGIKTNIKYKENRCTLKKTDAKYQLNTLELSKFFLNSIFRMNSIEFKRSEKLTVLPLIS